MDKTPIENNKPLPALASDQLRPYCDPAALAFTSTDELEPVNTLIGQDRAINAIRFGTEIDRPGYNLFALGPQGTGRHTAVMSYLEDKAATLNAPDDWVYVHNFSAAHKPKALRLPAGIATAFSDAMDELIDDLRSAIPAIFQSDEYREKRHSLDAEFEEIQEKSFEELREKAAAQDVAILRTPMGFALAPMHEGNVIKPEVFEVLPGPQKKSIEETMAALQKELTAVLEQLPKLLKEHRENQRKLNAEFTGTAVDASIQLLAQKFSGIDVISQRLEEVREDLVENSELFTDHEDTESATMLKLAATTARGGDGKFNRYRVNVMVHNDGDGDHKGAPLVREDHPTLANLMGRIEHKSEFGALVTDVTMIRPGALHRSNGGYLVLDVRKVLTEMFSWEALKRTLHSETIAIVSAADQLGLASTASLEPEPIPLKVKVVLVGERMLYYLLCSLDHDFPELFKVEVDFDEQMVRSEDNIALYARLIASLANKENLKSLNAPAVAKIVEEVSRLSDDAERLSLRIGQLADLLREADFWATDAGNAQITELDVTRAVKEQIYRADRIRERRQEMVDREIIQIDTAGAVIGQVNALSVLQLGTFSFGQPSRISTRVRMGTGKVIDIERETKLGGPLHSKGVLILSSYLAANYALDAPVSLWASIVFEQSYGGVDGDSASSAELYSLLSSLSGVPIKQSFAVTGSVDQFGSVQAIGGVNQKIEGFFDTCNARGLSGEQGVLIPASNSKHLILREDIVEAAAQGKFHIYPVKNINQGIERLTGKPAGVRNNSGNFPADSINGLVEERLLGFANARRQFAESADETGEEKGKVT